MHSWVGSFFGSDPRILKIGEEALGLFNKAQEKNGIEIVI
jgi:hypothetical protein